MHGKLEYVINISEQEYKHESGLQSPTGSAIYCKREEDYSDEDSNDKDAKQEVALQDENEDTAATLLAMTMSTAAHKLHRPLLNPAPPQQTTDPMEEAHRYTSKGSRAPRSSLSNKAYEDPIVANLKQEMQEMK